MKNRPLSDQQSETPPKSVEAVCHVVARQFVLLASSDQSVELKSSQEAALLEKAAVDLLASPVTLRWKRFWKKTGRHEIALASIERPDFFKLRVRVARGVRLGIQGIIVAQVDFSMKEVFASYPEADPFGTNVSMRIVAPIFVEVALQFAQIQLQGASEEVEVSDPSWGSIARKSDFKDFIPGLDQMEHLLPDWQEETS